LSELMAAALDGTLNRTPGNARRAALEKLETAGRRAEVNQPVSENTEGTAADLPDPAPAPIEAMIAEELMKPFSRSDRTIIEMRRQGATHKEIAKALGKTPPAITQRLALIRRRLSHSS